MDKRRVTVRDTTGAARAGATVTVKDYPSEVVSTIYSANSTDPGNVITDFLTNSKGQFEFYAPDGRYIIEIYYDGSLVDSYEDELIEDGDDTSTFVGTHSTGTVADAVDVEAITKVGGIEDRLAAAEIDIDDIEADYLTGANNLSDVSNATTARGNLNLSDADIRTIMNISAAATYQIGSGGDYASFNAAIADLTKKHNIYNTTPVRITLNLKTGEAMAEQIIADGIDLSWITITGADASHTITRSALTTDVASGYGVNSYPAFAAVNGGKLPHINQKFAMDTSGTATDRDGIVVLGAGSSAIIGASGTTGGVTASAGEGLYVAYGGVARVATGDFNGAGGNGFLCHHGGRIQCSGGPSLQNAGSSGISCRYASVVSAASANCQSATAYGIYCADGSIVDFDGNASSSGSGDITVASGGIINAAGATGTLSQTANTVAAAGIIFQ